MKQQVRQGVFETNSSSVHTISIYNDERYKEVMKNTKYVYFGSGEYGWEPGMYEDDASYLWTAIVYSSRFNPEEVAKLKENISTILAKYGIEAGFQPYNVCASPVNPEEQYTEFENWAYIDHAYELGEFFDYITNIDGTINEEHLLRYLFGSYVRTGNDNDDSGWGNVDEEENKDGITLFVKGN